MDAYKRPSMRRSSHIRRLATAFTLLASCVALGGALLATGADASAGTGTPACTMYVSPAGGGDGSSATSPTLLATAVGEVFPGSVVCLEPGTYDEIPCRGDGVFPR